MKIKVLCDDYDMFKVPIPRGTILEAKKHTDYYYKVKVPEFVKLKSKTAKEDRFGHYYIRKEFAEEINKEKKFKLFNSDLRCEI